ncbi:MAG: murein DD-endopeptidase MepM/ murein hydrolase activator NlpD [Alphaproteobacteria bacterium]|jgi:murein DD-endopeptidase MepM/ murein hydrolase activator NlpD
MKKRILISSATVGAVLLGVLFFAPTSKETPSMEQDPIQEVIQKLNDTVLPPIYIEKEVTLKKRQTLSSLLTTNAVPQRLTAKALHKLQRQYNVKQLRPGQHITLSFKEISEGSASLDQISFYSPDDKDVRVSRNADRSFTIDVQKRKLNKETVAVTGTIDDSLYASAKKAGLPAALVPAFANLFAWEIDFTRDIRPGARFRVVYEKILDENGIFLRSGNVLAAELTTKRKTYDAYRSNNNGWTEYFSSKGFNKKRTLLRTPLEFTRISSHYNRKRKHPVLGYTRAHKGTDFAAPRGTPVKAAGDGVIEKASWYGSYGRYIRIRHDKQFKTAYAHLTRFARGIKTGKRIKQGQTIGYVGTTGRSTGPHLHYEVLRYGKQVNAMRVKLPTGKKVKTKGIKAFNAQVAQYKAMWTKLENAPL